MTTAIEWTDAVWNPVTGCNKVSEGCRNCYAFALHDMRHKAFQEGKRLPHQYAKPFNEIQLFPDRIVQPLKWRKHRWIFVNSMSDLFHDDVPNEFIATVFGVMAAAHWHTFQILTKRPERMKKWFEWVGKRPVGIDERWFPQFTCAYKARDVLKDDQFDDARFSVWPLPNVWLGVSVENQKAADERIPLLLETPAAVRFLSCEPLLGPVDLEFTVQFEHPDNEGYGVQAIKGIDWVIVGGESGPNARPMHPDWAEGLRDQCEEYGVPFFFKQWGEWALEHELRCNEPGIKGKQWFNFDPDTAVCRVGKERAGRLLDGQEWNQFPGGEQDASRA